MIGWSKANKIWEVSQQHNIQIISRQSPNYPKGLLQISDPPLLLHVLGNIDAINKVLADAILKNNGALVSEYPWGTKTNRSYFVARDRIQSGLSLGVFVVFENEDDIDLIKIEMDQIKKKLLVRQDKKKEPRTFIQKTWDLINEQ